MILGSASHCGTRSGTTSQSSSGRRRTPLAGPLAEPHGQPLAADRLAHGNSVGRCNAEPNAESNLTRIRDPKWVWDADAVGLRGAQAAERGGEPEPLGNGLAEHLKDAEWHVKRIWEPQRVGDGDADGVAVSLAVLDHLALARGEPQPEPDDLGDRRTGVNLTEVKRGGVCMGSWQVKAPCACPPRTCSRFSLPYESA